MAAIPLIARDRDRTILWGLLVSIALHGLLMLPPVRDFFKSIEFEVPEEVAVVPMEFTLVTPPERPVPSDRLSPYISTVSSRASDVVDTPRKTDLPHGEGEIPIPDTPSRADGAEGGGKSDVPPLPEETADLGDVFQHSKFIEQQSPQRAPSFPEQNPEFRNEGSASAAIGGIKINTTAWDFAPYLLDLKHRIKQHWLPPLAFAALGAIHGYTWVRFRIYPDGRMTALEVVDEEGHESLRRSSVNAINGAAPFRPLPERFPEPYLEITFGFYYLLPGDAERYFRDRPEPPR